MESELQGLRIISGTLVTGQNRCQPALLFETAQASGENENDLINHLWPAVDSANANMSGHGRIARSMILLAKDEKPLLFDRKRRIL